MWSRRAAGRTLTFHLAGINNQNFLMRDEETGSFWQQISGRAISGPLAGSQLQLVPCEELTFGLWRKENPQGAVLLPAAKFQAEYEPKDWESKMLKQRTVVDTAKSGIAPRTLMFGLERNGAARAFPVERVLAQKLVKDRVGTQAVVLAVGPDDKSVRAFLVAESAEFYRTPPDGGAGLLMDAETGSRWDFKGCAVSGPAAGRCLEPIHPIKDYWFDWRLYHPATTVYSK